MALYGIETFDEYGNQTLAQTDTLTKMLKEIVDQVGDSYNYDITWWDDSARFTYDGVQGNSYAIAFLNSQENVLTTPTVNYVSNVLFNVTTIHSEGYQSTYNIVVFRYNFEETGM